MRARKHVSTPSTRARKHTSTLSTRFSRLMFGRERFLVLESFYVKVLIEGEK